LADAEAELAGDPAAGVKWAERWRDVILDEVKLEEERLRHGTTGPPSWWRTFAAHTDAEIDLLRRREAVKGGPVVNPEDKLKLYTKRVELMTYREGLLKELIAHNSGSRDELLSLTIARAEAEIELIRLKESMAKKGK
jgi:hypothetical protein